MREIQTKKKREKKRSEEGRRGEGSRIERRDQRKEWRGREEREEKRKRKVLDYEQYTYIFYEPMFVSLSLYLLSHFLLDTVIFFNQTKNNIFDSKSSNTYQRNENYCVRAMRRSLYQTIYNSTCIYLIDLVL